MVTVKVPATTANLGPGFDILGMALGGIYNYITLREIPQGLEIIVEGEGKDEIPRDDTNVVFKAVQEVLKISNTKLSGIKLHLKNEIPVSRGLGSSAAAIVGGLVAANELVGKPLGNEMLLQVASKFEGHPDNVAPALLGKVVISAVIEKKVIYRQIEPPKNLYMVVAVPDFHLSTKAARDVLPMSFSKKDAIHNMGHSALLVWAMLNSDLKLMGEMMEGDKFHQPYRKRLVPGMENVFLASKNTGAYGVCLSGAGPSIIAFSREDIALEIGEKMVSEFKKANIKCSYKIAVPSSLGAEVIKKKNSN